MSKHSSFAACAPLLLVIFIDGMGLSLLFPVLGSIIIDTHSHFLPATVSISMRDFLYGLTIGIFMICWFFGAAILGDLSDTIGRKKALMVCLLGAFLGYLLSAVAVAADSLTLLIAGRIVAGFTAGSQPIAQAAIVDVSLPENRARNIGFIILSSSLGFVIGPILGGFLSNANFVFWFNFSTPLYFAALISLSNAFLLWWLFTETFSTTTMVRIQFSRAMRILSSAFQRKEIRYLSIVLLLNIYGWSNYFSFLTPFAIQHFNMTPIQISLLLADLGAGFSISCGYLVNFLVKRFRMPHIITVSYFWTAIFIALSAITNQLWLLWTSTALIGISMGIGYATIITLFSHQVSEQEQGWVMGVTGSVMALCFGLTSLAMGYVATYGVSLPMYLAAAGIASSAVLMGWPRSTTFTHPT